MSSLQPQSLKQHRTLGVFGGLLSGVFWGADAVFLGFVLVAAPFVLDGVRGPMLATALHDTLSFILLTVFLIYKGRLGAALKALKTRSGRFIMLGAICGGPLGMTAFLFAISRIGAGKTAVITAMYPAVGALLAWIFLKDRLKPIGMIGFTLAIVCSILVGVVSGTGDAAFDWLGFMFAVLCTFGWGVEVVICAYGMQNDCPPDVAIAIRQATSSVVYCAIILPVTMTYSTLATQLTINPWLILAAIVGTLSYKLYYYAIDAIGPTRAMGLNISYSAWAVFICLLIGQEQSWQLIVLSLFIIVGSLMTAEDFLAIVKKAFTKSAERV